MYLHVCVYVSIYKGIYIDIYIYKERCSPVSVSTAGPLRVGRSPANLCHFIVMPSPFPFQLAARARPVHISALGPLGVDGG